jgi:hypothetical protein
MKYYIYKHDFDFDLLKSEDPFHPYIGAPITLGIKLEDFPKITLSLKSNQLPDAIPNFNSCIVFSQKIISLIKEAGADYIQYFDVDVKDKDGAVISDNYKCLNIVKVVDAIDYENSKLTWSDIEEGETEQDRSIRDLLDLRLDYAKSNNELLFRLEHCESLLLFREDLARAIINKGCTGIAFYDAEGYCF